MHNFSVNFVFIIVKHLILWGQNINFTVRSVYYIILKRYLRRVLSSGMSHSLVKISNVSDEYVATIFGTVDGDRTFRRQTTRRHNIHDSRRRVSLKYCVTSDYVTLQPMRTEFASRCVVFGFRINGCISLKPHEIYASASLPHHSFGFLSLCPLFRLSNDWVTGASVSELNSVVSENEKHIFLLQPILNIIKNWCSNLSCGRNMHPNKFYYLFSSI
jgi:hypothetical protein